MSYANPKPSHVKHLIVLIGACVIVFVAIFAFVPHIFSSTYTSPLAAADNDKKKDVAEVVPELPKKPQVAHIETPEAVKAIYMSQCVSGTPSFRDKLVTLIDETELNSVIIDIKDFTGKLAFTPDNPDLATSVSDACGARDMKSFVETLHAKDIYVIGRITVFQDPHYTSLHPEFAVKKESDGTVWKDHKGLAFIDVGAEEYWKYIVDISRSAYEIGFDELNFDYIRYPSDGNMKDIAFTLSENKPKAEKLEEFFAYLHEELSEPWGDFETVPKLSADLFGYTTTNTDDLGIGQVLERTLPYFDYVMPMVYPSHYNAGFINIAKPATSPYEVVNYSMETAATRAKAMIASVDSTATSTEVAFLRAQAKKGRGHIETSQLRPWLQDFDLGATYTPEMVRAQMQATYDAGLDSWALWDAGNTYTRAALKLEDVASLDAVQQ